MAELPMSLRLTVPQTGTLTIQDRKLTQISQMWRGWQLHHKETSRRTSLSSPNELQNSWLNATFHSVLNLRVTRRLLPKEKIFLEASSVPCCVSLIHSAVRQPGKHFSKKENLLFLGSWRGANCHQMWEKTVIWLWALCWFGWIHLVGTQIRN